MSEVITKNQLMQYMSRVEKLESDKAEIMEDIKQVYSEAKVNGFDVKIMKQVIKLRKLDPNKLAEQDALIELYRSALEI